MLILESAENQLIQYYALLLANYNHPTQLLSVIYAAATKETYTEIGFNANKPSPTALPTINFATAATTSGKSCG